MQGGAQTPSGLTTAQKVVLVAAWWQWWVAPAALFLKPRHHLVSRHATWAFGWGIFTSVLFGFGSLLAGLAVAAGSVSGLVNLGWHLLGVLVWVAGAVVNTYAVLRDRGPWLDYPDRWVRRSRDSLDEPPAGRPPEVSGGPEPPAEPPQRDAGVRYAVAVLLPTAAVLSLLGLPQLRAYLQERLITLTVLLAGLSVFSLFVVHFLRRGTRPRDPWWTWWLVFGCGTAAVANFWFSDYVGWEATGPHRDMEGIAALYLFFLYVILGYTPALVIADLAWLLMEVLVPAGGARRLFALLGAGLLGWPVGLATGVVTSLVYVATRDVIPLSRHVREAFAGPLPRAELRRGHLILSVELADLVWPAEATSVLSGAFRGIAVGDPQAAAAEVEGALEQAIRGAVKVVRRRRDVREVTVLLQAQGVELARFHATEAEARDIEEGRRSIRDHATVSRELLHRELPAAAGRLTDHKLGDLVGSSLLRAAVEQDAVRVVFQLTAPWGPDTADQYWKAWQACNEALPRIVRLFPQVQSFLLETDRQRLQVHRGEVGREFSAQTKLVPSDRVLVVQVHRADEPRPPYLSQPRVPVGGGPVLVTVGGSPHRGPFTVVVLETAAVDFPSLKRCTLYEPCWPFQTLEALYVGNVEADGTASVVVKLPPAGRLQGPFRVEPGGRAVVGESGIYNLGWFPRSRFPRSR